jgi:DNA-binding response OmpR family regulator
MRLLVVEDEPRISDGIKAALDAAGYACDVVADGEDAWFRGDTEAYDLVVLDLGLPKMDGLSVLKRWRSTGRNMPVLVLTARGTWPERVEGIDAGADDYLAKPFRTEELVARVRALIRRSVGQSNAVIKAANLSLDTRQMRLLSAGQQVQVSPLEYRLVAYLMHHKGRVIATHELIEHSTATTTRATPTRSRR